MSTEDYSLHYSQFHPDTEDHTDRMVLWMKSELAPLLPAPTDNSFVLDIGCGFGYAMLATRDLGFAAEGVEISAQQADRARRYGLQVEVVSDTAAWLFARPARYTAVLMLDVLEHIALQSQIPLLRAVHASLRPGGRIIVKVPNANSPLASRWRYIDHTHHCSFTEHSLHYVLLNGGFEDVKLHGGTGIPARLPKRIWRRSVREAWRRTIVRWAWDQVFRAELAHNYPQNVSYELNLTAVGYKISHRDRNVDPTPSRLVSAS